MKFSFQLGKLRLALGSQPSPRATPNAAFNPRSPSERSTLNSPLSTKSASPIQAWLRGEDVPSANPSAVLVSPFQQSIWVYTVVSALAQTVSTIPFRISQGDRSGENILTQGPVVDLFNRPHPYLNRFRFWEFIVTWYCLRGEAFIVALDKSGNALPIRHSPALTLSRSHAPTSLLVLNPDQFRHVVEGFDLVGWRFTASPLSGPLGPMELTPEEVIHDFLPNPYFFWRGMSPLSVAMLAAQTDYASAQFMKGLMLNNADTGVIVRTDQQLSGEQREQMMAALRMRKASAGTADHPLLLWGGAEVIQPTLSSADLQFMDNRKMNRQEICAAFFRMPQSLVGFTENANRSIAESERLNFIENSITPLCARLEAAIEPVVKSFGPDLVGWFDVASTPILQAARRSRVDTAVKLFTMGYTANAINKNLDLGLPHLTWGDKGFLPATLQQAGEDTPPSLGPAHQAATPIERMLTALKQLATPATSDPSDASEPARSHPAQPAPHRCSASPAHEAFLQPRIKQKRSKLSSFFFDQRRRVLAKLATMAGTPSPAASPASLIFNPMEETQLLLKKLTPLILADLEFGFAQLLDELPVHNSHSSHASHQSHEHSTPSLPALPQEKAIAFLAEREARFQEINQATYQELDSSLQEGVQTGESFTQLAERVRSIFQDASDRRADTIAGSETNTAVNTGRFFGMEAAGVQKKGWQTVNDAKVRPAHSQAQADYAQGIPLDEPFIVGGEALMYPGDPHGSAGNIINCRCWTYPIQGDQ